VPLGFLRTGALIALCLCAAACSSDDDAPPVAEPSVAVPGSAAIGRVIDVTYRFVVPATAPAFDHDYTVFVHVVDERGNRLWTSDHQPPTPTRQWRAGSVVEYTRPMRVPRSAREGRVRLRIGLYLPETGQRMPLSGERVGRRIYDVAAFDVHAAPAGQADTFFAQGWHGLEVSPDAQGVEWRWSRQEAIVLLRNPERDCVVVIELDQPVMLETGPQRVEVRVGADVVDSFEVPHSQLLLRRIPVPAAALGTEEYARVALRVDRTFVPARIGRGGANDQRELGVRVFSVEIASDANEPSAGEPSP
jgi:hypothetical protein